MKSKGLKQAYDAQDIAANLMKTYHCRILQRLELESENVPFCANSDENDQKHHDPFTKDDCNAIAALISAWDKATDRVRIIRGRPLPGVLKPEVKRKHKADTFLGDLLGPAIDVKQVQGKPDAEVPKLNDVKTPQPISIEKTVDVAQEVRKLTTQDVKPDPPTPQ